MFQNVTQNLLSQNYGNLLHLYHTHSSVQKQFQRLLLKRTKRRIKKVIIREFPSNECKKEIRLKKIQA